MIAAVLLLLAAAGETSADQAVKSAEAWLSLVDASRYVDSWKAASGHLRSSITKDEWVQSVGASRALVGRGESRKLESAHAVKNLPNGPKGDYVICEFIANFSRKAGAAETVIMFRDADKRWRTSGYFVK